MEKSEKLLNIPINKILPNPHQSKLNYDSTSFKELVHSIKNYGVISPIQVRRINTELYELVSGQRRLEASKMAQLQSIPAIIIEGSCENTEISKLFDNIQKENLNCFEEALSYTQIIDYYGLTQKQVAQLLGKSQSFIANKVRLLKLSPEISDLIIENSLSERHARALLKLPNPEVQKEVIFKVIRLGLSVQQTEELIANQIRKNRRGKLNSIPSNSITEARACVNIIKSAFRLVENKIKTAKYIEIDKKESIEIKIIIPK